MSINLDDRDFNSFSLNPSCSFASMRPAGFCQLLVACPRQLHLLQHSQPDLGDSAKLISRHQALVRPAFCGGPVPCCATLHEHTQQKSAGLHTTKEPQYYQHRLWVVPRSSQVGYQFLGASTARLRSSFEGPTSDSFFGPCGIPFKNKLMSGSAEVSRFQMLHSEKHGG